MGCAAVQDVQPPAYQGDAAADNERGKVNIEPYADGVKVVPISGGDGSTFPKSGDDLTMHYVSYPLFST